MQTLQRRSGSGLVTLPKDGLERDGVLDDDGEIPEQQNLVVDRLGRRVYLVRLVDDARVPDAEETEVVERLAAQRLMQQDAFGRTQTAD
ncbi:hypothetical protein [Halobaculum magnesiiphilum]|uniref:DUF8053 domain-containing protein n=1 Tax=Halobaculum magnesiiphilum TaxID=1017351 RepID=A0A8T8WB57_9EURY|nr:hypothetical protein [Halobaculum magnesiiphilum]QZP37067.1 hypothetical protein K6T50_12315 [Halobaculum magnesiiphilum]